MSLQVFFCNFQCTDLVYVLLDLIHLGAIINGIIFLNLFSTHSFLVYRHAVHVCVFLYPGALLNSVVNEVFCKCLGSSIKTRYLHIGSFISCPITLARISSVRLNESGESRHPC